MKDIGEPVAAQGVVCFARGTRLAGPDGEQRVECLAVGDRLLTASGQPRRIVWIGRRRIDCARHPDPNAVWPVRVRAGAFGPGLPRRDLLLSPQHAVFAEGVLIPVRVLANGGTIRAEARRAVEYFHVELDRHDVLLAEGLPVESYLDTGDRACFENGGAALVLHPDFARLAWDAGACAELKVTGPEVEAVRASLAERARAGAADQVDAVLSGSS
jgi:collagen type I alpha